jgi:hypothetical protein
VRVGTDCPSGSFVTFGGSIDVPDVEETVEARWFVDYSRTAVGVVAVDFPAPSPDGSDTRRSLAGFRFFPGDFAAVPGPHVVEVVVSNGFFPIGSDAGAAEPNRTAQGGFETQLYRWVVLLESGGRCE